MPKDAFDHLVDLVRLPDVDLHRQRIEARVSQSRGAILEVLGVAAADDDACAELAQTQGYRQPDTSSASCDDGDLVLKRRGCSHVPLPESRIQEIDVRSQNIEFRSQNSKVFRPRLGSGPPRKHSDS